MEALQPMSPTFSCKKRNRPVDSFQRVISNVLRNKAEDIDAIILTRFDVKFQQRITDLNIDWAKTNIAFPDVEVYWKRSKKVSDLFFIIPIAHAYSFNHALEIASKSEEGMAHGIYSPLQRLLGPNKVNFIKEEGRSSNIDKNDPNPSFLYIDRNCDRFDSFCKGSALNQCNSTRTHHF